MKADVNIGHDRDKDRKRDTAFEQRHGSTPVKKRSDKCRQIKADEYDDTYDSKDLFRFFHDMSVSHLSRVLNILRKPAFVISYPYVIF